MLSSDWYTGATAFSFRARPLRFVSGCVIALGARAVYRDDRKPCPGYEGWQLYLVPDVARGPSTFTIQKPPNGSVARPPRQRPWWKKGHKERERNETKPGGRPTKTLEVQFDYILTGWSKGSSRNQFP